MIDRDGAWQVLTVFTKSDNLRKHALAVETSMRAYAVRYDVRKELRDKTFARTVNRDDVYRGAAELGLPLDEHIAFVVQALTAAAPRLGLG